MLELSGYRCRRDRVCAKGSIVAVWEGLAQVSFFALTGGAGRP